MEQKWDWGPSIDRNLSRLLWRCVMCIQSCMVRSSSSYEGLGKHPRQQGWHVQRPWGRKDRSVFEEWKIRKLSSGSPEVRSSRPAWPIWWNPISTKTQKLARYGGTCLWSQLLGRLRQGNGLNLGGRGCSETRWCQRTPAWVKRRKRKKERKKERKTLRKSYQKTVKWTFMGLLYIWYI